MSYPVINRWGLNLFWTKFWYSDKFNISLNHCGNIFETLILLYLNYGFFFTKSIFISKYWYWNSPVKNFNFSLQTLKYFRFVEYNNKTLNDHSIYKLRLHIKNIYFSKIWMLISQKWIVLNLYLFNPIKKRRVVKKKKRSFESFSVRLSANKQNFFRFKIIFFFFFEKTINKNFYYNF